jgi:hypothetical protein
MAAFGLTPAEARVAVRLAQEETLDEAARARRTDDDRAHAPRLRVFEDRNEPSAGAGSTAGDASDRRAPAPA